MRPVLSGMTILLAGGILAAAQSASLPALAGNSDTPTSSAATVTLSAHLPASRSEVWDALTGDISGWWDHRFSTATPAKFAIEARPGGHFIELFDPQGAAGVIHATVIYVQPEEKLVLDGPLGFNGEAVQIVTTLTLAADSAAETVVTAKVAMAGALPTGAARAVGAVWDHFLNTRLKGYLAAGCRGGGPCEAFK